MIECEDDFGEISDEKSLQSLIPFLEKIIKAGLTYVSDEGDNF